MHTQQFQTCLSSNFTRDLPQKRKRNVSIKDDYNDHVTQIRAEKIEEKT